MELTHDVTDNTGTLGERLIGAISAVIHRIEHAAVDGLKTIADVRQCPSHNDAHCVVQVGPLHFYLQVYLVDPIGHAVWILFVSHI
jgi:hypothetical protein